MRKERECGFGVLRLRCIVFRLWCGLKNSGRTSEEFGFGFGGTMGFGGSSTEFETPVFAHIGQGRVVGWCGGEGIGMVLTRGCTV